jgi:polyvinyl alcohol dehydrogenase (cytochrome)
MVDVVRAARLPCAKGFLGGHMRALAVVVLVGGLAVVGPSAADGSRAGTDWPVAGHDVHNTRHASGEHRVGPDNVAALRPLWTSTVEFGVAATPSVSRGVVHVPDLGGNLWAFDAGDGAVRWSRRISEYTGVAGDISRSTPAVHGGLLVLGNLAATPDSGAWLVGVDAATGALRWRTKVDGEPWSQITGSPVVDQGVVYAGVSSRQSAMAGPYTFRGSVVALDARTGRLLWQTHTVPDGYTGGAVWGSTPVVDRRRGLIYVGTGQNHTVPDGVCETPVETGCAVPAADNHIDAVLALDRRTGGVVWARKTLTADAYNATDPTGPDYDFGSGPNLYTTPGGRQLLGIGQKSGLYWALDPGTGRVVWTTRVGPGSASGGIMWGSATDGRRVYTAVVNGDQEPYTIRSVTGETSVVTGGSWAALDAATGRIIWQTADPHGAGDAGFVTTANGVVYAGSMAGDGDNMYALDAATGTVRWRFPSGGAVVAGAAVVNGTVYWGSGYYSPDGVDNDTFYAFSLRRS